MATIIYLDTDDEITTAAARIREASEPKIAIVLPPGSRLATSRMNFRLLAHEALEHRRDLAIVAPDPAARSIAASAGLAVHATVGEYEASIAPVSMPPAVGPSTTGGGNDTETRGGAAAIASPAVTTPGQLSTEASGAGAGFPAQGAWPGSNPAAETRARSGAASLPVAPAIRQRRAGGGRRWVAIGAVLLLAVLAILAVVGYTVLPSATIVVTPQTATLGPKEFPIRADPNATAVDATAGVVPASRLSQAFVARGGFPATGRRVVAARATGMIRFTSLNTVGPVRIVTGTQVSTLGGQAFVTQSSVIVPRATVSGTTITAGHASVAVVAAKAGPDGNVGPGEISRGPDSLVVQQVSVANPDPTSGGARQEFVRVSQKDIDAALAQLSKQIQDQFGLWVQAPDGQPTGTTIFPTTAVLAAIVMSPDPSTLVNVEESTFQLGATSSGTVLAVDAAIVRQVATEQMGGSGFVPAGHMLVAGSVAAVVGTGVPDGDIVDFRVTVTAMTIPTLDAAALMAEVRGKPVEEARRILSRYGTVTIDMWPGFVTTIPTLDARLQLTIGGASGPDGSAAPSQAPQP
jgi:hypothetical protein